MFSAATTDASEVLLDEMDHTPVARALVQPDRVVACPCVQAGGSHVLEDCPVVEVPCVFRRDRGYAMIHEKRGHRPQPRVAEQRVRLARLRMVAALHLRLAHFRENLSSHLGRELGEVDGRDSFLDGQLAYRIGHATS